MYNPYDHYFNKAKKKGFKARSAFKLEEIDDKFSLFGPKVKSVIDIGCSPGSWLQYASTVVKERAEKGSKPAVLVGFDLKVTQPISDNVFTYQQDIEDVAAVKALLDEHGIVQADVVMSDMAPDTTGNKSIDALRSIALLESTLWMYEELLAPGGKFAIKVFMGPGFDGLRNHFRKIFGVKNVKVFKPKSCRKESKETYIVGWRDE